MSNPWRKQLKQVMSTVNVETFCDNGSASFGEYYNQWAPYDYDPRIIGCIDKRFQDSSFNELCSWYAQCGDYILYIFTKNKQDKSFPLLEFILFKKIRYKKFNRVSIASPSYIRDIDDFKHYWIYFTDILKNRKQEIELEKKQRQVQARKYLAVSDDFSYKVDGFVDKLKEVFPDLTANIEEAHICKFEELDWSVSKPNNVDWVVCNAEIIISEITFNMKFKMDEKTFEPILIMFQMNGGPKRDFFWNLELSNKFNDVIQKYCYKPLNIEGICKSISYIVEHSND